MSFADPIGDMITRIRNAQMRTLSKVKIPSSKFRAKPQEELVPSELIPILLEENLYGLADNRKWNYY